MFVAKKCRQPKSSPPWRQLASAALTCISLSCPLLSMAAGDGPVPDMPGISLHGFGTLGFTRTDDDKAQFVRDLSQSYGAVSHWTAKVDSLFGLQANTRFSPRTEAVLQAVIRQHANQSYQPELTWAFLRHDFSPDFSLRGGRLGTEFYMLGDSRLVGYSNISVRPPPDFYGSLVFSYIDGFDVSATLPVASGLLKGKMFAGKSPEESSFAPGISWNLQGSDLFGGYVDYWRGPWQLRLSHAQVQFARESPFDTLLQATGDPLAGVPYLSLVPDMALHQRRAHFSSMGLVYDQGPFNMQLMLNRITHDSPAYADSKAGYVQAAYRLGAVTPYLGVSRSFSRVDALPGSGSAAVDDITKSLVLQSVVDQHTYTLGGRWDIQKNRVLKAQVDWLRGKPASVFLLKNPQPGWDGQMTIFSLALDFVF